MYKGLSTKQVEYLLQKNGPNEIPQKKPGVLSKIIKNLFSPISIMLLIASSLSLSVGKIFDAYFILVLLILNVGITLWQERKADNAIDELNKHLAQNIKVFRDGVWKDADSRNLVAGDVIQLSSGEVIPADGKILEVNSVSVNESAVTGESLPKNKALGDKIYSGTFLVSGVMIAEITATGPSTNFGKTVFSVESIRKRSLLEKDIISISKFLTIISILAVIILTAIFLIEKNSFLELLTLDISLVIAGIPISLPTVMTLIIEIGVLNLAKKKAIVRRLSALEDLANVNFLLTDKTGTLTKNKIVLKNIYTYSGFDQNEVLFYASIGASMEGDNPIDDAILDKAKTLEIKLPVFEKIKFNPFDPIRKQNTAIVKVNGKMVVISTGAPQKIESLCEMDENIRSKYRRDVESLANKGYRTLAVAIGNDENEKELKIAGLLALSDELRDDAKSVIQFLEKSGIGVSMVTGDNKQIAHQISIQIFGSNKKTFSKKDIDGLDRDKLSSDLFTGAGAFSELVPEDKLKLVENAKKFFVVAANGDGINDLPALKAANVGIAVKNAVMALKSSADIVLLSEGISVIKDAIIESRKIFERIYSYSLYRISESFRLIVTITILGILYKIYPLTPLQIILIALLNDIPIISLAFDHVKVGNRPKKINVKNRLTLSSLYGTVGVLNSLFLFFLTNNILGLNWSVVQTIFFLKLTISGHLLIYVAHTKERWFKYLPSKEVILATSITQIVASMLAFTGFLMPGRLSITLVILVWVWALLWMQAGELVKHLYNASNTTDI